MNYDQDILQPHVVILGSGSTIAAIPNGDRNGHRSFDFASFGTDPFFKEYRNKLPQNYKKIDNLEKLYLSLTVNDSTKELKEELDSLLREKFKNFELPETMTVLDWLVLSLRDKDYIISFNWDPLLIQAYNRVRIFTENLPNILFPHGNVEACYNNERYGAIHNIDNVDMMPSPLVFPIKERDYENNIFLADQIKKVQKAICGAGYLTIFGYSGAETDEADVQLMKNIFMPNGYNAICNGVEIIGPPNKRELIKLKDRWAFFSAGR